MLHGTHGNTHPQHAIPVVITVYRNTDGNLRFSIAGVFRLRSKPAYRAVTIFSLRMADKPGLGDIAVITRWYIARKQGRLRRNVKSGTRDIHRLFNHRRGVVRQSQQVTNFQCSGNFIVEAFIFARQEIPLAD
ncbi:Uncharacterised protein [Shigella sonnei]|nr:Uncharacterised protein [Shigella sonnei]